MQSHYDVKIKADDNLNLVDQTTMTYKKNGVFFLKIRNEIDHFWKFCYFCDYKICVV